MDVIIIGAGIAGLNCALKLHQNNFEFLILEASDGIGGRVRTDELDGFLLDRGFQVFLTAYPEAKSVLDYSQLDLKPFYPGALLRVKNTFKRISDPWRKPLQASRDFLSGVIPRSDQLRIGSLRSRVISPDYQAPENQMPTLDFARDFGFSEITIQRFLKPFFGGIFLENELTTSHAMFEFVFRMMSSGDTSLPAQGMVQIPQQIAGKIPSDSIRLQSPVVSAKNRSVQLESGEELSAKAIIVATDWTSVNQLIPALPTASWNSVNCLYFSADRAPFREPILVLSGEEKGPISNLAVQSNVSRDYAPRGKSLISATVVDWAENDGELVSAVQKQLKGWYGNSVEKWTFLRRYDLRKALPKQDTLPPVESPQLDDGLFLCGDYLQNASLNGAMLSGRLAAEAVIRSLGR